MRSRGWNAEWQRLRDELVRSHENMKLVKDLMRQAEKLSRKVGRYTRAKPAPGARGRMRQEIKQLKADVRMLERQAIDHVLDQADIVCATTTFNAEILGRRHYDLAVIDEACQSTEPGCWIPILHAQRVVLAGDHRQLPPTVISSQAEREGFAQSLLERVVELYGDRVTRRLNIQYRMHRQIMQFSSQRFYDGLLQADDSVAGHLLADLPEVSSNILTDQPLTFIDTAGAGWDEQLEPDGESRRNPDEGRLVLQKVQQLIEAGLAPEKIAVITPYAAQVRWLREQWQGEELEIDTVDGFQGREKEAVIISLVRSNTSGEIGFLADVRRMNVALTRARRKLIVIGDSATLASHEFYESLLSYFDTTEAYHTVWEEM